MAPATLTFVVVVAVVFGSYWFLVSRPEGAAQAAVRRRLRSAGRKPKVQTAALEKVTRLSSIPALGAALDRSRGMAPRVQGLLDRAGMKMTVGRFVLTTAVSALAGFALVAYATGTVLVALLIALLTGWMPFLFVRYKANKRMNRFEELFPEAIGLIIRALRAGHAFTTGLAMVAEEMADPVGPEFRLVYDHQNFGMPVEEALKKLAERIPLLDVRFFVTAILTQRDAGGNLAEILENIASVIRDRFKVKRQVRVITAHARITGAVLAGMPPACGFAVSVIAPDQMKTLFTDPLGIRMVIIAVVMQVTGALMIRKIVNIEY